MKTGLDEEISLIKYITALHLTNEENSRTILEEYADCFSQNEGDLGRTSIVRHNIDTGGCKPIKQVLRRLPTAHLEEIDRQVSTMLEQDIIEYSCSPWSSNVVIVKKKDGSLRFCVDYRRLNDVTTKDSYPLPRISDCLDALATGRYFSAFDLRSGYFQVLMDEADKEKTSFVTRSGLYQFKVMPFGVTNGPATFQRLMDMTLAGLNYQICLVYLDDIILMSRTVDEHLERLKLILDRLRTAGLKLKPSKCNLLQKSISFLGHIVSENGIAADPVKVQAVAEWPRPTNVTEVRSFLGLCSYYRRFVQGFAAIAGPLHALTGKNAKFVWTIGCQDAFVTLKQRLIETPILAMPQDHGTYYLDTDASDDSIGAVLSQEQDGEERVIAYASRLLTKPERNYCVTRRELLAVVYFCKQFRNYLLGRRFTVRTDHSALRWLRNIPEPVGQQARWLTTMEEFDFEIEHRAGRKHGNADSMSRRPCRQCDVDGEFSHSVQRTQLKSILKVQATDTATDTETESESDPEPPLDFSGIEAEYQTDPQLSTFYTLFEYGKPQIPWDDVVGLDSVTKSLWTQWDRFKKMNGKLYRKWYSNDGETMEWQLIPPQPRRKDILRLAHTGMTGGHMGIKKTMAQVQRRAYWPGWQRDVRLFCRQCHECTTYHRGAPQRQGPLQAFPVGEPMERLAIDLTGPHPPSRSGHTYILTVVDLFTKWAEAIPLRNKEAISVARALVDVVISRFGVPLQILSDNGREFDNSVMKEICRLLQIDKLRTTAYKPSTNGAVERFHRTLNAMIGKVVANTQRNWDECLPTVMAAYRASKHESTGSSPNLLMLGRENLTTLDMAYGVPEEEQEHYESFDGYADKKIQLMRQAYKIAREHLGRSAERSKRTYDMRVRPAVYSVGQWVYYYYPRRYKGKSPKWQRLFTGPYLVTKVTGPVNVQLQQTKRSQPFITHVDKLRPCLGETPKSWILEGVQDSGNESDIGVTQAIEDIRNLINGNR